MLLTDFFDNLQKETARKIRNIEEEEKDALKREYSCPLILAEANSNLKAFIINYQFKNEEEEIWFFKYAKPKLVSQLIYHSQVYNIEMNRPVGGVAIQRDYLNKELENLQDYIDRRPEFYSYYRLGATDNDVNYFTRDKFVMGLQYLEPTMSERETRYSTNCDYKLAKILANEQLEILIQSQLDELDNMMHNISSGIFPKVRMTWTGTKTDLIELIYALDTEGCFDQGKVSLTQIAVYFETVFNIDLSKNIARNFYDMKIRQQPTPFLDRLKEKILKRMENTKHWGKKKNDE